MRHWLWALSLCSLLLIIPTSARADQVVSAPRTMPERIASAWHRARGPEGANLLYIRAAAEKFNIPASSLATAFLVDVLTHHKDWEEWAAAHPEVRSEGTLIHISPASALSEGLLRSDLVLPDARRIFDRKSNDINYVLNPQPGVDHWYQSCLEAAGDLMTDDGVLIGLLARQLRRTADTTVVWSRKLNDPFARPSPDQVRRLLSQAQAWPEDGNFGWETLQPGRSPWPMPAFSWVYGRYRMRAFDAEPHDELLSIAAQVWQWMDENAAAQAELAPDPDALPLVAYRDTAEDYSFR